MGWVGLDAAAFRTRGMMTSARKPGHSRFAAIIDQLRDAGSLKAIVKRTGENRTSIHRDTTRLLGSSPGRIIRDARLRYAARQIVLSDRQIIDIAVECGYDSHAAFSRSFKRSFGTSPIEMRARSLDDLHKLPVNDHARAVVMLPAIRGIKRDYIGHYDDIQASIVDFIRWALATGAVDRKLDPYVVYSDLPFGREPSTLKAEIVLPVDHPGERVGHVYPTTIPGGPCYETYHTGSYASVIPAYHGFLRHLLRRDVPSLHKEAAILEFDGRPDFSRPELIKTRILVRKADDDDVELDSQVRSLSGIAR
jgi:AraC family transcriptional regulator